MKKTIDISKKVGDGYLTSLSFASCRKCGKQEVAIFVPIWSLEKNLLDKKWVHHSGYWYCPDCAPNEEEK